MGLQTYAQESPLGFKSAVMRSEGFEDLKYRSRLDLKEAALPDGWPVLEPLVIR